MYVFTGALPVIDFYPRPLRGGRPEAPVKPRCSSHFYPRPLRGGRRVEGLVLRARRIFLSTPSARRATAFSSVPSTASKFLSTPSARRATPLGGKFGRSRNISIHALCEEGDDIVFIFVNGLFDFYPRPLRGGRPCRCRCCRTHRYFYPRPLRGGRQQKQRQNLYFQTNYTTFCTNLEEP